MQQSKYILLTLYGMQRKIIFKSIKFLLYLIALFIVNQIRFTLKTVK